MLSLPKPNDPLSRKIEHNRAITHPSTGGRRYPTLMLGDHVIEFQLRNHKQAPMNDISRWHYLISRNLRGGRMLHIATDQLYLPFDSRGFSTYPTALNRAIYHLNKIRGLDEDSVYWKRFNEYVDSQP